MSNEHSSTGILNLPTLLRTLSPSLHPRTFVFTTTPSTSIPSPDLLANAEMLFREPEAWTLILPKSDAVEARLGYVFECRKITLNVHSSLEAVGFMAAVSERLKALEVGINAVSGYYHDHLFVPVGSEGRVMEELEALAKSG